MDSCSDSNAIHKLLILEDKNMPTEYKIFLILSLLTAFIYFLKGSIANIKSRSIKGNTITINADNKIIEKKPTVNETNFNVNHKNYVLADKFRWQNLPFLQFNCLNAKDIHSYQNFMSIKNKALHTDVLETTQSRYLPNIHKHLEEVSLDEKVFRWGKLFAKPDAVFFDKDKNEYLVVEYKNREFYALASLTPLSVFQLLVSAEVVKKHIFSRSAKGSDKRHINVRSFMRLNNKVIEVRGWKAAIQHVLAMLPNVLAAHEKDSISASQLARSFVLFDKVFKFRPKNEEDACFLGKLKHILMSKPAKNTKAIMPGKAEEKSPLANKVNGRVPPMAC